MTDELDQLPDAQLSEVFAVEVAEWTKNPSSASVRYFPWLLPSGAFAEDQSGNGRIPEFAEFADAVLPFLQCEGVGWSVNAELADTVEVSVWPSANFPYGPFVGCSNGTGFARAACIALIRAKRAQKGQP